MVDDISLHRSIISSIFIMSPPKFHDAVGYGVNFMMIVMIGNTPKMSCRFRKCIETYRRKESGVEVGIKQRSVSLEDSRSISYSR